METTLYFKKDTSYMLDPNYWDVRINIRGTPEVVEMVTKVIREHMKKTADAKET